MPKRTHFYHLEFHSTHGSSSILLLFKLCILEDGLCHSLPYANNSGLLWLRHCPKLCCWKNLPYLNGGVINRQWRQADASGR